MKKVFSFPEDAVGNLASGGSISNLIALTSARDKHKIKNENAIGFLDLSPQNWYLAGSGGYINSGDFDGGMISGRLGWDFFEKSILLKNFNFYNKTADWL